MAELPPLRPRPGVEVDAYRLVKRLGGGASSQVWEAEVIRPPPGVSLMQGARVALKLYISSFGAMPTDSALRIHREFAVASDLEHPNIVRVHDLVIAPTRPLHSFLVMDLVDGRTLKASIPRQGLEATEVVSIGLQLFSALDHIHSQGAIHRDIKAANIMVRRDGDSLRLTMLDFGIVLLDGDVQLTAGSVFLGSKHSSPPEQLRGHSPTPQSDIYGAGSVLFHCLQGRPMYEGIGTAAAILEKMNYDPERLSVEDPRFGAVEQDLAEFINRCVALDPADRPASAEECSRRLEVIGTSTSRSIVLRADSRRPLLPFKHNQNGQIRRFDLPDSASSLKFKLDRPDESNTYWRAGFILAPEAYLDEDGSRADITKYILFHFGRGRPTEPTQANGVFHATIYRDGRMIRDPKDLDSFPTQGIVDVDIDRSSKTVRLASDLFSSVAISTDWVPRVLYLLAWADNKVPFEITLSAELGG